MYSVHAIFCKSCYVNISDSWFVDHGDHDDLWWCVHPVSPVHWMCSSGGNVWFSWSGCAMLSKQDEEIWVQTNNVSIQKVCPWGLSIYGISQFETYPKRKRFSIRNQYCWSERRCDSRCDSRSATRCCFCFQVELICVFVFGNDLFRLLLLDLDS